ncbi:ABC-type glycine betaine transport, ATP-binding protein [Leifsonia xyli subsp. cynodontis DSM 46306]|uniref:ABC transporter domain-containing protein n=1 Tax=Leifsonia xyli subsp. cynodontis DSM 46306 TaxID=1389489 RepID=U3PAR3_LEIXC|nr:betaine/proline/choline family ABC transporter ATP-binding protein [Leifsonia xyli]AGW41842.1 ABC-type glycine betaine transport, ATP-binding protein [Leifsonia xyli subsp. cynodontis DSM 46306]
MSESIAVEATKVFKVFGRKPTEAVRRLREGAKRAEVTALGTAAVIDASLAVRRGEIFVVMGLSGSGKSTLIRLLNGLLEPTAGEVAVMGTTITGLAGKRLREVRQRHISMVFQHFALMPHRTVLDNIAFGLEVKGVHVAARREKAEEVLELVGLGGCGGKLLGELSGGMQQRVGLGRALAADTDVLLMDEAFSALDPLIRREMQEQLLELQAKLGKTIVFITHDLNEAMLLGDRIAVMRAGRIVQTGTPEEILTDPANDYVASFVQDVDRARVLTAASVMEPARSLVTVAGGPRVAMRTMRDLQTSAAFVVGQGWTLLGAVRDHDVMRQVREGRGDLTEAIDSDIASVSRDEALSELVEPSVGSALPLAVVDERHRLLGVIPRVTLLAALGNVTSDTTEIPVVVEPPATVSADAMTLALRESAGTVRASA